jgi:hypothetical protein
MTTDAGRSAATVPADLAKSVEEFLAGHGETASAVLQPAGREGVRITLVGADEATADYVVGDVDTARAVVDQFDAIAVSEWDNSLLSVVIRRFGAVEKAAGWAVGQIPFLKLGRDS